MWLVLLGACGPTSLVLDDPSDKGASDPGDTGADGGGDSAAQNDDSGEDSGDPAETGETAEPPADCLEYLFVAQSSIHFGGGSTVDAYDSALGAYSSDSASANATAAVNSTAACAFTLGGTVSGSAFTGADPGSGYCEEWGASLTGGASQLPSAVDMPEIELPAGLPSSEGAITFGWGEVYEIPGDAHYDSVAVGYGGAMTVATSGIVWVEGDFAVDGGSLTVNAGDTVELYVGGNLRVGYGSALNSGGEPAQLRIRMLYGGTVTFDYGANVSAIVEAPFSDFANNGALFAGTFIGNSATSAWGAATHLDLSRQCP